MRRAYLLYLGREPESDEAVAGKLGLPLADLLESVVDCEEFRIGVAQTLYMGKVVPEPAPFTADDLDWARRSLPLAPAALSDPPDEPDWGWLRITCLSDERFPPARPGSAAGVVADRLRVIHSEAFRALFDADWYARRHPEVRGAREALAHYLAVGGREGRDPHPLFVTSWYLRQAEDWDAYGELTPLEHYLSEGAPRDLSPYFAFDAAHYREQAGAFTGDALSHYLKEGRSDGHDPHPYFNSEWYVAEHMDHAAPGRSPLLHFAEAWGSLPSDGGSGRSPRPSPHLLLDLEAYLHDNPDVAASGLHPFVHYVLHGEPEGRRPHRLFDAKLIQRLRKDDENAQARPLGFYLEHGDEPGLDPNPYFDNGWYARQHDLKGLSALEHYLLEGVRGGAPINSLWDEELYLTANPDLRQAMTRGLLVSGSGHFLSFGAREIVSGAADRRYCFRLGDSVLDYIESEYLEDNVDVPVLIRRGKYATGLDHFLRVGLRETQEGLRAVYKPARFAQLRRASQGGAQRSGRYACVFAHYDADGWIDDYVVIQIQTLRELGFDVYFVTAATTEAQLAKVSNLCISVLQKSDAGRDFQAWRLAIEHVGLASLDAYDHVCLMNDSTYFPVNDPSVLLEFARLGRFDFWGITDSSDWTAGQYHLQSYFLGFSKAARQQLLPALMERVRTRPVLTKRGQIIDFEIGFTAVAMQMGLSVGALCPIDDIREDVVKDIRLLEWRPLLQFGLEGVNPTLQLWKLLLIYYRCPVLKIQLLRENPSGETDVDRWPELIDHTHLSSDVIRAHQLRLRGELPPGAPAPRSRAASTLSDAPNLSVRETLVGRGYGQGRRLVLLAHYDPDDLLDDHVVASIRGLREAECDTVVITSTDKSAQVNRMREEASGVVIKSPNGRDFGSWSAAIESIGDKFDQYDSVIWMNDSTYFPMFDAREMFSAMTNRNLDFWGVVDSYNVRWHIMSWFWSFDRKIIREGVFDWFQSEYNPTYTKWAQIKNYEIRIPQMLKSKGYSAGTFIEALDVERYVKDHEPDHPRYIGRHDFTMTHEFWDVILDRFRCPALKVELLRDNPLGMDLSTVFDLVRNNTDYDVELIRKHLRRIKCGHLPIGAAPTMGDEGGGSRMAM